MKTNLLLVLFLSNIILISNSEVECDGNVINHCSKCKTGDDSDTCTICDDKYFLFFNDLLCIPCNDPTYGQIACEGNCDGSNFVDARLPFCEKGGCAEGYYNLNGICTECSVGSPWCKKCTYEAQENETDGQFICLECESSEYGINSYGVCELCAIYGCEQCHYENNTKAICDKCYDEFFRNSEGECSECYYNYDLMIAGECYICSENETEYEFCQCRSGYAKIGEYECEYCDYGCNECSYNNKTEEIECTKCYESGFVLGSDKKCYDCGERCESCYLDEEKNPICLSCYSNAVLLNGKCLPCEWGCLNCTIDPNSEYKNETICTACDYNSVFNPEKKNCTYCSDIPELGDYGCQSCLYNEKTKKYECLECSE